jgi:hypothetical protein
MPPCRPVTIGDGGDSVDDPLKARILAARKLSLDQSRAIYDLTSGIDFSRPRRTAEAIAQVVWEVDVKDWWTWKDGEPVFAPDHKVELRMPAEHHRKVAKAVEEFEEGLKNNEFAPEFAWYTARARDDRADWLSIFIWGPLWSYLMQQWSNRRLERDALDRLFSEMSGYIVVTPT